MTMPSDELTAAAAAFVDGFHALISVAQPAELRGSGTAVHIHFPAGRKELDFSEEFFLSEPDPIKALTYVSAARPGPKHFITVIAGDPTTSEAMYRQAGYRLGWVETLMIRDLPDATCQESPVNSARPVQSESEISAIMAAWEQSIAANGYAVVSQRHLAEPSIIQFAAWEEGMPTAYGRAIMRGHDAYVSDIITFPEFRRRGYGRAIMQALHREAARRGAKRCVLTSTVMGVGLYRSEGYREVASVWIYEPDLPATPG